MVLGYGVLSVWMTWPLVTRLGTSLAGDYGDPVFDSWVIAWVSDHLTAVLGGGGAAWSAMWDAPIFAPEQGTLAYSDHLLAQSVQALPIWWLSHNPLLAYNTLFLTTMTLTAVASHGLAARLSGSQLAGVVAALTCTFNDYRSYWLLSHLQVLSVQWWLFGLWALDVFVASRSTWALTGAAVSLLALNYSSSYLMAYCGPFTAAFTVWSLARHGRLRDSRAWMGVVAAGLASLAGAWPVVSRYLRTQDGLAFARSLEETSANSVTFEAYTAALPWMAPFVILAVVGAVTPAARTAMSRRAKWGLVGLTFVAFVLSFGPHIRFGGQSLPGPYLLLREHVPGFDGLRVPHRFIAILTVFLSLLAGTGAAWLARRRTGLVIAIVAVALVTRHGWEPRFPLDRPLGSASLAAPAEYLRPAASLPPLYRFVAITPAEAVIAELPFGDIAYEIRYTYFTALHRRRTVNGYSGILPPSYLARRAILETPFTDPDASWSALAPATHVIVHTGAWTDDTGKRLRHWLESRGARVLADVDGAWLYALPPH